MLKIHGEIDGSAERSAAEQLAKIASTAIPTIENDNRIVLELFPSAQCFGQKIQDVDLLVFFADYRRENEHLITDAGSRVHSFCAVIEVKSHPRDSVVFDGPTCSVRYQGKLHQVTGQSEKQKYSVKEYIERNSPSHKAPWITNLIWLTQVPASHLPQVDSNLLGSDLSWNQLVGLIARNTGRPGKVVETFSSRNWMVRIIQIFSKHLEASKLDRRRTEKITKKILDREQQQYASKLGEQLLMFRGRGGTGKTIRLIQIAYQAYEEMGLRILFLTYNKALVADLRRLLTLLGVRDALGAGSIVIKTIHSFMHEWLAALDLIVDNEERFFDRYEALKQSAIDLLNGGALTIDDVEEAKRAYSRTLAWDLVLIDESQDWPPSERDLIYRLYGHKRVIIADGVDQLVRDVELIDWREGLNRSETQVVPLRKSLRLKSALCQTVNHFAEAIDLQNWNLDPVPEAYGGKVVVVVGDALTKEVYARFADAVREDGNDPIDMLICVPPSWVDKIDGARQSKVAKQYREWGWDIWDAVDPTLRGEYPTRLSQFRIVQYESCRGLEGWIVVNVALDEFFEYKQRTAAFSEAERQDIFFDPARAALEYAKKWTMIPLTRAIDTLVMHVTDPASEIGRVLASLRERYPDEVEWIGPRN